jgi:hypothetical protein
MCSDLTKLQDQKTRNLEAVLLGVINQKTQETNLKLASELDKVLDQLNNIQQVSYTSSIHTMHHQVIRYRASSRCPPI